MNVDDVGDRISTENAIQIQFRYCHEVEPYHQCPSRDKTMPMIFDNRICDGIIDCPNGADEDGLMAPCKEM